MHVYIHKYIYIYGYIHVFMFLSFTHKHAHMSWESIGMGSSMIVGTSAGTFMPVGLFIYTYIYI